MALSYVCNLLIDAGLTDAMFSRLAPHLFRFSMTNIALLRKLYLFIVFVVIDCIFYSLGLQLTDKSATLLSDIIRNSSDNLQTLTFFGNQFTSKTISAIANPLIFCKKLSVFAGFCPNIKSFDPDFALAIDQLPAIALVMM